MLAKNDFINLAKAFQTSKPEEDGTADSTGRIDQWREDVKTVADVCAKLNPRLNKAVWLAYVETGSCRLVETDRHFLEGFRWK